MIELRRVGSLPPYVFAAINELMLELRRGGEDVIDLGFGNPDLPSPEVAVEKLREAVLNPRNHRYSASRGIPNLRRAVCDLYRRRFGVELDPETQALTTIGAKEALAHLMWVLLEPGDVALVPSPSYPGAELPASGKAVTFPFAAWARVEDGLIREFRGYWDVMGFMQQIGAIPEPAAATA